MKLSYLAILPMSSAFVAPPLSKDAAHHSSNLNAEAVLSPESSKPLFDPLGLYPKDAPERKAGLIQPMESLMEMPSRAVIDPLSIYPSKSSDVELDVELSASLPFAPRPALLDGNLPGDRGFDPFNFSSDAGALQWYRKAEIKHARLAMLAAVGWPIAELLHKDIASALNWTPLLASQDRVPSILNDGLSHIPFPAFWIAAIAAAAIPELILEAEERTSCKLNPGDLDFDPLAIFKGKTEVQQHFLQEAELFNGRLGMLAITGFAIQEWFLNSAVVDQIPIFFKPLNMAMEQLMMS